MPVGVRRATHSQLKWLADPSVASVVATAHSFEGTTNDVIYSTRERASGHLEIIQALEQSEFECSTELQTCR